MSLDGLFGIKKSIKKSTQKIKTDEITPQNRKKLKCEKKSCHFTRIIRKKVLDDQDFICSICGGSMREVREKTKKDEIENEDDQDD